MSTFILFVFFIAVILGVRKLFRAAKANPEAALWCVGAARRLLTKR